MAQNALVSALAQCRKLAQLQKIVLRFDYFESIGPLERKSHAKIQGTFPIAQTVFAQYVDVEDAFD